MFTSNIEEEVRRKVIERISTDGVPNVVSRETLIEERKNWFKVIPKERKFKRPLTWVPDVEELNQTKNIKQFYYGLDVEIHDLKLWKYIKWQAKNKFPDWKPQFPKQEIKFDPVTKEKDITLKIKPPRCLKNMPLRAMKQDFCEDFQVNCSKKDIDCLFFNKIVYEKPDKVQAQQYQKMANLSFAKDINSGRYWERKFRDIELEEFLKKERRSNRTKAIHEKAEERGKREFARPITDQTPIRAQEEKLPRWEKSKVGIPEYDNWWKTEGRVKPERMLAERAEK
ncbi:hypothetical protein Hanom_Chr06g00563521 [Helianthus anomalus]